MIDKYYLIKYVYNTPELTSNVFRFCDGALGGVLAGFASSTPKAPEEYTDYDWGMLYDKRVSDIDRAMRAYISASGTYDGDDVVSLIDQLITLWSSSKQPAIYLLNTMRADKWMAVRSVVLSSFCGFTLAFMVR